MYITTFYSYKGGVGRSMALVNIAALLASQNKRVLIVDFDLEAPGISTYTEFCEAKSKPGIVDYVHEFLETNIAPDVQNFIVNCKLSVGDVWLMPAGDHSCAQYSSRLTSINWLDVYRDHSGFLMIEDLKQQWRQFDGKGFDYVLIDSRTGHTDVGGICTRQMPDSIVLMFFPNEQNILGLVPIIDSVKEYENSVSKSITKHFCPSNVPDLDDEKNILKTHLEAARTRLGYEKNSSTINHYNSMDLIDQIIFTIDRSDTKLSSQYKDLCVEIMASNFEDRDGAVIALERLPDSFDNLLEADFPDISKKFAELDDVAKKISESHANDAEIGWLLSEYYLRQSDRDNEIEKLGWAIDGGYRVSASRFRRAVALLALNEQQKSIDDLRAIILSNRGSASSYEIVPAVEILRSIDPDWFSVISTAKILRSLDDPSTLRLIGTLTTHHLSLPLAEEICVERISDKSNEYKSSYENKLELIKISLRKFKEFVSMTDLRINIENSDIISDIYNYGIAVWGMTGDPPTQYMKRVADLSASVPRKYQDANYMQCLAVAYSVLGNFGETISYLEKSSERLTGRGRIFSTWNYLDVTHDEMREHLNAMKLLASSGAPLKPSFLENEDELK